MAEVTRENQARGGRSSWESISHVQARRNPLAVDQTCCCASLILRYLYGGRCKAHTWQLLLKPASAPLRGTVCLEAASSDLCNRYYMSGIINRFPT